VTVQPLPPDPSRRGFLRASAGGAAAAAFASVLPAGCARDYPQARADGIELAALSDKEYAVARAVAEALLVGVPVRPEAVAAGIDRELALVGDPVRADMKSVLGLIEHLTFLGGHGRRFSALTPGQRRANLQSWARSRFALRRGAYQAVRGFVNYFAYIQPETRAVTGFRGSWPENGVAVPVPPVDFGEVA
jgi:hypothetical protein